MQSTATPPVDQSSSANASRKIKIDGMSGDACVKKVTAALKTVPGCTTQSVVVGSATITADEAAADAAVESINKAGFKASYHSNDSAKSTNTPAATQGHSVSASQTAQKSPAMPVATTHATPAPGQPAAKGSTTHDAPKQDGNKAKSH